ncbi:MAG: DUF3857 domain-containing protein [Opitutus sp.]
MRHRFTGPTALLLGWILASVCSAGAAELPDWAVKAAVLPTPETVGTAAAVVLFDETARDVEASGLSTVTRRVAIRLLTPAGKDLLRTDVGYLKGSDKVKGSRAWLVRKGYPLKAPEYVDWVDRAGDPYGTLYGDYRIKSYSRAGDAVTGDVFVAETQVTGPMLTAQDIHGWGWDGIPVVEESYRLKVPPGFVIHTYLHGSEPPSPVESSDRRETVWTIKNQPFVRSEPHAPAHEPAQAYLMVNIEPPSTGAHFAPVVLHQWADVATWLGALNREQCDSSSSLTAKSLELTAGCTTSLEKVRALGAYVQSLRYVAFNSGLAKGLGYQPRKATQVFSNGYGDCKDKANLLCAMLHEVGVEAFIAAARSGDDRNVWPEFAAASQFDHAIAAVRVTEPMDVPSIVKSELWGSLLFFDPTAQHTSVGDLPWYLQGTSVFVQAKGSESLTLLPTIEPKVGHLFVRKAALKLNRDGSYTGDVKIAGKGQAGAELRQAMFAASSSEQLTKFATELLGESNQSARLAQLVRSDDAKSGLCGINFNLAKSNHLQFLKNSLVVAKVDIFSRGAIPALTAPERLQSVKLRPVAFQDEIELALPDGLQPEELPAAATFSSIYGHYERDFKVEGRTIKMTRRLELNQRLVPIAEYAALRKFLTDLGKADRASILLKAGS